MLKLKHIPVKSFGENIAYIYKDCALYKVDDLNKVTKLEIHKGNKTIYAFLQIVAEEGVLAADEIGLNDDAFNTLNMSEGTEVHVSLAAPYSAFVSCKVPSQSKITVWIFMAFGLAPDNLFQVHHLDCGKCAVITLVSGLGSGSFDGLLDVLGGDDAEEYRNAGLQAHLCDALCGLVGHQLIVGSGTADNCAHADYRIVLAGFRHLLCHQRNFECARYPSRIDVAFLHAVTNQAVHCAVQQFLHDEAVETRGDDAYLHSFRCNDFSF